MHAHTITTRRSLALLALVFLLGALALAACGGQGTTAGGQAAEGQTEPVAQPSGDPARGAELFQTTGCVSCHTTTDQQLVGPGLRGFMQGEGPYGDQLPNGKPLTDANVAEWIKLGGSGEIGNMPGNPALTDEQLMDLVAYLKTLE